MSVTQLPPNMLYNGDMIVQRTDRKTIASIGGHFDTTSISDWYKQDPDKNNLGMIKLWGQGAVMSYPIYTGLLEKKAMLEVDGADGKVYYDVAIKDSGKCVTVRDTSLDYSFAGIDDSVFRLVLNKRYEPGDVLAPSFYKSGVQVIVTDREEIQQVVGGWSLPVTYVTNDKKASYDPQYLKSGRQYFKVAQNIFGEYGTNYGNFDLMDTPTTMKCMFQLGNMSGHEFSVTGRADMRKFSGATSQTKDYLDELLSEVDKYGEFAIMTEATNVGAGGQIKKGANLRLGAAMELLLHRAHQKAVNTQFMFQDAAIIPGAPGSGVTRLNEGIYKQMRRGKIITYARPMGMTRADVADAMEYVFVNNPLPEEQREAMFSVGKFMMQNFMEIFKEEVKQQNEGLGVWNGADRIIPKSPVSGKSLLELEYAPVRFTKVYLPGIGNVSVKHDPSLDYRPGEDRFISGMHQGGLAHTTYSAVIWDVSSQTYSNNRTLPTGATLVEGGDNGANVYIIKPQGSMTYWGSENGRYDSMKASDIVSSNKFQMQSWWIYSMVAGLVLDKGRFVIIELDEKAEPGFN